MKRSDLTTQAVLEAVRDGGAWDALTSRYPEKVVLAALVREDRAGRIDYGTTITRPWLTGKGKAAIAGE